MATTSISARPADRRRRPDPPRYARGLLRAAGGAIVFSLPLLMTTEMWELGFVVAPERMLLMVVLLGPLLALLSAHAGFERTSTWIEDARDAVIAFGIAFASGAATLWLLGVVAAHTSPADFLGKATLQAVPGSIGAMLARSQLEGVRADSGDGAPGPSYAGELFIMLVGAIFLGFSVAPTDEVIDLALGLSPARTALVAAVSLVLMHAFVYAAGFRGQERRPAHVSPAAEFLRLTVVGYVLALAVSAYLLWTFGRLDGLATSFALQTSVVLGLPSAVGAAAARLIL